jgi:hypothetical protein
MPYSILYNGISSVFYTNKSIDIKNSFSVSMWIYIDPSVENNGAIFSISENEPYGSWDLYDFDLGFNIVKNIFIIRQNGGFTGGDNGPTLIKGEWIYITLTYNGSNSFKIYIGNETEESELEYTREISPNSLTPTRNIVIGGGNDNYFKGYISDVRIYTEELSLENINLIRKYNEYNTNLIGWWNFSNGYNNLVTTTSSPLEKKGDLLKNVSYIADVPSVHTIDTSESLIQNDFYQIMNTNIKFNDGVTNYWNTGWSVSLWFKIKTIKSSDQIGLFSISENDNNQFNLYDFNAQYNESNGIIIKQSGGFSANNWIGSSLHKNEWYNLVFAYQSNAFRLYINSIFINILFNTPITNRTDKYLYIGKTQTYLTRDPEAYYSNYRFYNKVLDQSEIDDIYTNTSPTTSSLVGYWKLDGNTNINGGSFTSDGVILDNYVWSMELPSILLNANLIAKYDATDIFGFTTNTNTQFAMMNDISGNGYHFRIDSRSHIREDDKSNNYFDFSGSYGIAKHVTSGSLTNLPIGESDNNDVTVIVFTQFNNNFERVLLNKNTGSDDEYQIYTPINFLGFKDTFDYFTTLSVVDIPNYNTSFNMLVIKLSSKSPCYQLRYNLDKTYYSINISSNLFTTGFSAIGGAHDSSIDPTVSSLEWGKIKRFLYYNNHLTDDQIDNIFNYYLNNGSNYPSPLNLPLIDNIVCYYDATNLLGVSSDGKIMCDLTGNGYNLTINNGTLVKETNSNDNYFEFNSTNKVAKYLVNDQLDILEYINNSTIISLVEPLSSTDNYRTLINSYNNDIQIVSIDQGTHNIGYYYNGSFINYGNFSINFIPNSFTNFNMYSFKFTIDSIQYQYNLNKNYKIGNSFFPLNQSISSIGGSHNNSGSMSSADNYWGKVKKFVYYNTLLNDDDISLFYQLNRDKSYPTIPTNNITLSNIYPTFDIRSDTEQNGLIEEITTVTNPYGEDIISYYNDDLTFFNDVFLTKTTTTEISQPYINPGIIWSNRWSGYFIPSKSGSYQFKTRSDDSSLVYIGPSDMYINQFLSFIQIGNYNNSNANQYLYIDNSGEHAITDVDSISTDFVEGDRHPIVIYYGNAGGFSAMFFQHRRVGDYSFTSNLDDGQFKTSLSINKFSSYRNLLPTIPYTSGTNFGAFRDFETLTPSITFQNQTGDNLSLSTDGIISGDVSINPGNITIDLSNYLTYGSSYQEPLYYSIKNNTLPAGFSLQSDQLIGNNITLSSSTDVDILISNYLGAVNTTSIQFNISS